MRFWERSEKHGEQWEAIFKGIGAHVQGFAGQRNIVVEPWHWDAPEEILSWSSRGVHKNLRLFVEEEPQPFVLKLSGSAWVDSSLEDQRERLAYYEQFEPRAGIPIGEPAKASELGPQVTETLEAAFRTVETWDLDFLRRKGRAITLDPWTRKV